MASPKKRKKQTHRPRHHRMNRRQRLKSARDTDWVNKYKGKRIVRGYRKRFGVDILCAITELRMLGVRISREYGEQARRSVEDAAEARRKRKAKRREFVPSEDILESDENFSFIAGYTSGGFPYGLTWEQWDPNEDCSLNQENGSFGTNYDGDSGFYPYPSPISYCPFPDSKRPSSGNRTPMTKIPYLPEYDQAALGSMCRDFGVRLLILFGSRATGSPPPTPESDLDMAVLFTEKQDLKGFLELEHALSRFLDTTRLDLADISRADPLFRWEICVKGKLLYGEELDFLQYKAYAFRDYRDSQDLRDLENALLEKKMRSIAHHLARSPEDEVSQF